MTDIACDCKGPCDHDPPHAPTISDLTTKKSIVLEFTPAQFALLNLLSLIGTKIYTGQGTKLSIVSFVNKIIMLRRCFGPDLAAELGQIMTSQSSSQEAVYTVILETATPAEKDVLMRGIALEVDDLNRSGL